uniref:SH3 domain-containing protein n=1 Tax=Caenorhabditis tropicalis TaxID=1561998 RepID=A0A1I7TFT0_9PELO
MSSTRRRQNLERVSGVLNSELQRLYNNQTADVMVSNSKQISVLEFIEYLYYKINDSINIVDGGQNRGFHRLARFQHKIKDKSGLAMTILTIPLSGENNSLPPPSLEASTAYPSPRGSNEYDEYEKISDDGFYSTNTTSSSGLRTTTSFTEPEQPTICRVLYDFEPKHSDEIQIREGQCVLVEDRIGEDWLIGHVISQPDNSSIDPRSGRFPTTYVSLTS